MPCCRSVTGPFQTAQPNMKRRVVNASKFTEKIALFILNSSLEVTCITVLSYTIHIKCILNQISGTSLNWKQACKKVFSQSFWNINQSSLATVLQCRGLVRGVLKRQRKAGTTNMQAPVAVVQCTCTYTRSASGSKTRHKWLSMVRARIKISIKKKVCSKLTNVT